MSQISIPHVNEKLQVFDSEYALHSKSQHVMAVPVGASINNRRENHLHRSQPPVIQTTVSLHQPVNPRLSSFKEAGLQPSPSTRHLCGTHSRRLAFRRALFSLFHHGQMFLQHRNPEFPCSLGTQWGYDDEADKDRDTGIHVGEVPDRGAFVVVIVRSTRTLAMCFVGDVDLRFG